MKNFWMTVFAAYVLCELARGSVQVEQTTPDWDEGLGADLCPECRPLTAPPLPRVTHPHSGSSMLEEEALGVDMCPECRPLPPLRPLVREVPSNPFKEEDRGVDTCPECRPLSPLTLSTATSSNLDNADLGVDMCPECKPLPRPPMTLRPKEDLQEEDFGVAMCPDGEPLPSGVPRSAASHKQTAEEDLGVDMCPECRPLQPLVRTPGMMLREDDLGTDMCPEKSQPMSVDGSQLVAGSESVVKELRQLIKMQRYQIGQFAGLLRQLGKIHASVPMEQPQKDSSRMPVVRVADDEMSEKQPPPQDALPSDSRQKQQQGQMALDTSLGENSATPQTGATSAAAIAQGIVSGGERGMTIARYRPAWSEHFSFLSAVKVDGEVSCLHVLPQEDDDGLSRYVVVGDTAGRFYIFHWLGDHLLDHFTLSTAPITAMLSYTLQKNETILVTGHSDGAVLVHRIWERVEQGSISNDGRTTLYSIATLHCLVPPSPASSRSGSNNAARVDDQSSSVSLTMSERAKEERTSVTILDMYKVGKMRYTLVGDTSGKIQVFRDNGSLHGVAQSPTRPLAFMRALSTQRLVYLTEAGMGLLDLRSMHVRSSVCEGLNTSTMEAYALDVNGRTKAHGFTSQGDLVSMALTGDMLHFECHVKKRRKVDVIGPFVPQALKGYLVAATPDRVLVFNTTMQTGSNSYANFWVPGPIPLFSATMKEIALSFLPTPIKRSHFPLLASNRDRLVVVGFGDGYVAIFRSNLPTTRAADFSARFWNSSILVSGLVLLVVWQLFTRKRDSAAVGSPEYPPVVAPSDTTGTGTAAAPASSPYDKEENVRLGFGQPRKGEPRRFRSPTRGYVDPNPTSFAGDSSRRFRSSAVDTDVTGYSTRREPLFSSTKPVGELGDPTIDNR